MIKVSVPATSANLGSGFDSLGIALNHHNTVIFELGDECNISSADGSFVPKDANNMIYKTAKLVFDKCGVPFHGLSLVQTNDIPMARGLGSSSACIAAGIIGANALIGSPMSQEDMLDLAVELEGHPDNVAPAFLGGFVTSVVENGHTYAIKKDISQDICFAAFIPDFRLLTEKARAALPSQISHKDAVYNVQRAALCAAAFCEGKYQLLKVATKDTLHQQYRLPLIEGGAEILQLCEELGSYGAFISGAGPTMLAVVDGDNTGFFSQAERRMKSLECFVPYKLHCFKADNKGAQIIQEGVG